jgi:hypothetical protein
MLMFQQQQQQQQQCKEEGASPPASNLEPVVRVSIPRLAWVSS